MAYTSCFNGCHGNLDSCLFLQEPMIDSAMTTGLKPQTIIGNMEFRDVWFRYPSRPDVPVSLI